MKNLICYFILLVLISCGHSKNESKINKKDVETSDTIIKTNKSTFCNLDSALLEPEKVIYLTKIENYQNAKHLPSSIGQLVNLRAMYLGCMEKLEDLPMEIGQLVNLEKLIIDNGNGCQMNIQLPSSIGQLQRLKELVLYGALDPRDLENHDTILHSKVKELPKEIVNLKNLEVLDLGRNGLKTIPNQVFLLSNLRILRLSYNDISEVPTSISKLINLKELEINANGHIKLPESLAKFKTLKVFLGNSCLKIKDQEDLKNKFPNIIFSFENEYDDAYANEE